MELRELDTRLRGIEGLCERIDERTENMQGNHEREIRAVHARIGEVREEAKDDVKAVRGEMKRMTGLISTAVSGLVSGLAMAVKALTGGN